MKVALCLSGLVGHSRKFGKGNPIDYQLAYQHFKKNIADNQIELDVFMHSWSEDYKSELIECYKPKDYVFEPQKNFGSNYSAIESNYLSYHYSKKKVIELKKKYEDSQSLIYDWVILTRFDILICKKLDFSEIRENNFYLVGPRRHHGKRCKCEFCDETSEVHCVSDLVFFSSSEKMDQFSKAYDFINEYGLKSNHIITKKHLVKTGLWENVDYYFTFIHNKYVHIWWLLIKVGLVPKGLVKARVYDTNVPLIRWKTLPFGQKLLDLIIFKFKIDIIFYYLFVYPIYKIISIPYIKSILLYLLRRSSFFKNYSKEQK